jgi:hypothetical protein
VKGADFEFTPGTVADRVGINALPTLLGTVPNQFSFFKLNYRDLNCFIACVYVGVHRVGRVRGEPVSFAGFPDVPS